MAVAREDFRQRLATLALAPTSRARCLRLATMALLAAILYLPALGRPPLWEPDEGRYAEIPREMVVSGDYLTPRDNWVRYFEKPPLTYWLAAAAIRVIGPTELAIRLPAAGFSVGQVVLTAALGEAMFDPLTGLLAAGALASSPLFFAFARFATLDPTLSFFLLAALAAFFMASRAPDLGRGRGRRWIWLSAAMLALGTLAKGPIALALGGAIPLLYLIARRRMGEIRRLPWVGCAIIYAVIALPWFVMVAARNPGFLSFFLIHEHLDRYLFAREHAWGPYFPALVALVGSWPWIYFAPLAWLAARAPTKTSPPAAPPSPADGVIAGASANPGDAAVRLPAASHPRKRAGLFRFPFPLLDAGEGEGGGGCESLPREARAFLLIWSGLVIVLFSIPRAKLGSYVLPAMPALAILSGRGIVGFASIAAARMRRLMRPFALINLAAGAITLVTFALMAARIPPALAGDGRWLAMGLVLCGLLSWPWRTPSRANVVVACVVGLSLGFTGAFKARADMDATQSCRLLARAINAQVPPGDCLLASDHNFLQALPFYTGRREALVTYRGELAPFSYSPDAAGSFIKDRAAMARLWATSACTVLVADRHLAPIYLRILKPPARIIARQGDSVVLYHGPAVMPRK